MRKHTDLYIALNYGVPQLFFSRADQLLLSLHTELDLRPELSSVHDIIDYTLHLHHLQRQLIPARPQDCSPAQIRPLRNLANCLNTFLTFLHQGEKFQLDLLSQYRQDHPDPLLLDPSPPDPQPTALCG